jgi:hypothetical protein
MSNKSPWVKASEKMPDLYDEAEIHYKFDGKKIYGVEFMTDGFEIYNGSKYIGFYNEHLHRLEYLDESLLESPARYSEEETPIWDRVFEATIAATGKKVWQFFYNDNEGKNQHSKYFDTREEATAACKKHYGVIPETVEKKEEVNEWLKKNWPEGKFRAFIEFMKTDRLFFVDEVRKWLNAFLKEEISFSKFVELFNEKVFEKYPASPSPAVSAPVDETDYLLSTKANRERLEESINQERAKEEVIMRIAKQGDARLTELKKDPNHITTQLSKDEITSYNTGFHRGYYEGFAASKDYAKGFYHFVTSLAPVGNYTDDQLIDLYDEHLKHLNQQK